MKRISVYMEPDQHEFCTKMGEDEGGTSAYIRRLIRQEQFLAIQEHHKIMGELTDGEFDPYPAGLDGEDEDDD